MDEEDGRPGPGARQSGPADVLADASTVSLCRSYPLKSRLRIRALRRSQFVFPRACGQKTRQAWGAGRVWNRPRTSLHHRGETQ